jgi:hypothetical protein
MAIRRRRFIALALVAGGGIVFAVVALKMWGLTPFETHPTLIRSKRPLSLAEVKNIRFPFPTTASKIQFAEYQDFIAYDFVVRFEAPKDDCLATVSKAVEAFHSSLMTPDALAELSQIRPLASERDHLKQVADFPVPWFDPESINEGVEAGKRDSHTPKIWIDTAHGVFYFQYTD